MAIIKQRKNWRRFFCTYRFLCGYMEVLIMNTTRVINEVSVNYNSTGPKKGNMKNWKMTDELRDKIVAIAKEDATKGEYGKSQKYLDLKFNELEKVAPNRAGLMSKAMMLQKQNHTTASDIIGHKKGTVKEWIEKMTGTSFGGETIKSDGPNMHIYDSYGDEILRYDSKNGWKEMQSREETKVFDSFKSVYYEAFRAAEKELKNVGKQYSTIKNDGINIQI